MVRERSRVRIPVLAHNMTKNVKLVTFVPESHANNIRKALGDIGVGKIGNYTHCSFSVKGVGRFFSNEGTSPYNGEVGKHSDVEEERIEMVCSLDLLKKATGLIREIHPYEEVAIDIHPILSEDDID